MKVLIFLPLISVLALGASVVQTIDAPDVAISGLGYGFGSLWAVSNTSSRVYQIDPSNGSVISSFVYDYGYASGLSVSNNLIHIIRNQPGSFVGWVYRYSQSGDFSGSYDGSC